MRLSQYAKELGITYTTAYSWFKAGKIEGAYQTETGTIIVPKKYESASIRKKTVVYARVSSSEQRKTNLETQADRLVGFCIANGWVVDSVVKEVGSGLNDERKNLTRILKDPSVKRVVVEHRDRLTRYGFNYLTTFAEILGFEIIVVNKTLDNDENDLMADFTAIITSFCARLYSQRRGKRKKEMILEVIEKDD
jgi:predicted site-specific integrase-resolvase